MHIVIACWRLKFNYFFYNNEICDHFIKSNFDENVYKAYSILPMAVMKADLWRYCVLYIEGGIYLDIKFYCTNGFKLISLTEKEYLEEIKKQKMMKMVEDILTKKGNDHEIMEKGNETSGLNKIISKNLESIKKLAKKEGISISKLINILKQGE
jgi:mannosyltransferase OCH1-like enzyme